MLEQPMLIFYSVRLKTAVTCWFQGRECSLVLNPSVTP